jgi:hypothetical protein
MSLSLSLFRRGLFNNVRGSFLPSSSIRITKLPHRILFSTTVQESDTNNSDNAPKTEKIEKNEKVEETDDSAAKDKQLAELKVI